MCTFIPYTRYSYTILTLDTLAMQILPLSGSLKWKQNMCVKWRTWKEIVILFLEIAVPSIVKLVCLPLLSSCGLERGLTSQNSLRKSFYLEPNGKTVLSLKRSTCCTKSYFLMKHFLKNLLKRDVMCFVVSIAFFLIISSHKTYIYLCKLLQRYVAHLSLSLFPKLAQMLCPYMVNG